MADLYEPDCGTAFYRSRDAIKNLKIKIRLERVTSASIVPQAQIEQETKDNVEMQEVAIRQNFGGQKDVEEYEFKWQEKVFSSREMDMYQSEAECVTVLERKYHQDTSQLRDEGRPTKRLFTYVDHDSYTNLDENVRKMTTDPDEKRTIMSEKMSGLRNRKSSHLRAAHGGVAHGINIIDEKPSEELINHNHYIALPTQTMFIMADLSPSNRDATSEDEFVLCTLKVDSNGVLSIRPDFSKSARGYRIEAAGMGRDLFEYTIEHASSQLTSQEQDRENKMFKELYGRHSEFLAACVGHEFEMPPLDMLRLLVFGEIESARNFEYSDLYVHYFIDLQDGWVPNGVQQLSGVTQTCTATTVKRDEVAYFSFPFSFELLHKPQTVDEKGKEILPRWPQIYFEVLSLDSWQRYRTEGYGYLPLPCTAGTSIETIQCWRPAGNSVTSEMRRFFIGGSPELEDLTYAAIPSTHEGKHLSKFGFRTKSTGSVTVKLNILQQSQAFLQSASSKKKVGTLMDRIGHSQAQANILNVIEAFQRAKQKMVAARDHLKKDLIETIQAFDTTEDDVDA